jgi:hypothetical protein
MTEPRERSEMRADDERLLEKLAGLVRERDPVPEELVEMARQTFTWRTVDAELAELVADSLEDGTATLVRSSTVSVRLLAFCTADLRLDLEVLAEATTRRLVGELDPEVPAEITVEHPGGTLVEDTDEEGRFLIAGVPAGRIRITCRPASGAPLLTPWLKI